MLFHVRAKYGCTVFVDGDRIETLDTKTDRTISALVYPSWHPSGKFVAFSINNTTQDTHPVHRTEVYDKASDVVVYDVEKQEIVTTQALFSKKHFETFPTFSPDGKQLLILKAGLSVLLSTRSFKRKQKGKAFCFPVSRQTENICFVQRHLTEPSLSGTKMRICACST